MLAPHGLWTQTKVFSEVKASRLPPYRSLFFHHYDWNRWFVSLATTVDNTIKMAHRSLKHGRQWCIRRIGVDYAGPASYILITRQGRGPSQIKRCLCVFTCLQTRACHLEVAYSLNADGFFQAVTWVVKQCGVPGSQTLLKCVISVVSLSR